MKTFVIANLQLGRPSAIKKYKRPFDDVNQMNSEIIKRWNNVVSDGDVVYHLGNFAWDPKIARDAITSLNGTIKFVEGEFDDAITFLKEKNVMIGDAEIVSQIEVDHKAECTFSYWPMQSWPNVQDGYYSVIGIPNEKYKSDPKRKVINVNAELWNYTPQELDKTIDIFNDF